MLSRILGTLLRKRYNSPQVQAIGALLLISVFFIYLLESGKAPLHADEISRVRSLTYNGIISKRELNVRGQYNVWMKQRQQLILLPDTHPFYEAAAYARLVQTMSNDLFPYDEANLFSLPVQVQIGDSIKKKAGALTIQIVRRGKLRAFRYKCPYHHYTL